jgi:hypothetical protein
MRLLRAWFIVVFLIAAAACVHAEEGIAWEVKGNWRLNHTQSFLHKSDAVAPGALLTADSSTNASVLVLLPDGQRLLFDCHNAHTCTQGFRIPALVAKPDDDAIEMFEAVRAAMRRPATITTPRPAPTTMETEAVVPIQRDGMVLLQQALAGLPPGQYRLTVQGEGDAQPSERSLEWSGPHDDMQLPLPHPGMYLLRLFGSLGVERMRVYLLVESQELFPSRQKAFVKAKKDLQEWNETFPGWPMHEWLQLYLQGLAQITPK